MFRLKKTLVITDVLWETGGGGEEVGNIDLSCFNFLSRYYCVQPGSRQCMKKRRCVFYGH